MLQYALQNSLYGDTIFIVDNMVLSLTIITWEWMVGTREESYSAVLLKDFQWTDKQVQPQQTRDLSWSK